VVLRKPGKPDYSIPNAYRPISLLNTLGKLLEGVKARRLSFYAEKHGLLPNTQFGGRPGRSTEQALLVLPNALDRALKKRKVVTLIAFDLKGAFNAVNKYSLDARLREKSTPSMVRRWIWSFMEERTANVLQLEPSGQLVRHDGGASAYIDDYFPWRAGPTAASDLRKLHEDDLPRIEEWARQNGAEFAAEKTELIHFTRKKREQLTGSITMNGKTKEPQPEIKLLGVIFDQELKWKQHVQYAINKGTKTSLALHSSSSIRH